MGRFLDYWLFMEGLNRRERVRVTLIRTPIIIGIGYVAGQLIR